MVGAASGTVHWTQAHKSKLVVGGIIALIALLGALLGWRWLQHQDELASTDLGQAMRTYNAQIVPAGTPSQPGELTYATVADRAKAAHDKFQKIADTYKHTHTADVATYFAAATALDSGNSVAAESGFKDLATNATGDLAALAKLSLASIYRDSARDSQAMDLYKDLAAHPTNAVGKGTAQLELAAMYEAKQPAEARKIYQEIVKDNPVTKEEPKIAIVNTAEARLKAIPAQ